MSAPDTPQGSPTDLVGSAIDGTYRIEKVLDSDPESSVYLCTETETSRLFAVKVLRGVSERSGAEVARFDRQGRSLTGLSHPNVVRAVDFGTDADHDLSYLVMEVVRGTELGGLLEFGGLVPSAAVRAGVSTAAALGSLHRQEIIHRNLRPDNLVLTPEDDGSVSGLLIGFGVARLTEQSGEVTKEGEVIGPPAYAAPEKVTGESIGPKADLYGLGALLFHALAGEPLFSGASEVQVLYKQANVEPPDLGEAAAADAVPGELEDLVGDLLSKRSDERPQSAEVVRKRLTEIRDSLDGPPPVAERRDFEAWLVPDIDPGELLGELAASGTKLGDPDESQVGDATVVVDDVPFEEESGEETEIITNLTDRMKFVNERSQPAGEARTDGREESGVERGSDQPSPSNRDPGSSRTTDTGDLDEHRRAESGEADRGSAESDADDGARRAQSVSVDTAEVEDDESASSVPLLVQYVIFALVGAAIGGLTVWWFRVSG
jgi:serine/threonine protein kinase